MNAVSNTGVILVVNENSESSVAIMIDIPGMEKVKDLSMLLVEWFRV